MVDAETFAMGVVSSLIPISLGQVVAQVVEIAKVVFFSMSLLLMAFDPKEVDSEWKTSSEGSDLGDEIKASHFCVYRPNDGGLFHGLLTVETQMQVT
jgi:hypothetical protein